MNAYNYFFPLNHNSLKLIYACNHEIIYDTPPSNYKTCAFVRVKKLGCVKEYLYLVRGKILLGRNYMNNIEIFHVGGHEAYLIANIVFDSDNKYKLIVKDKLFATIEVRDTKPIGVSVVLENMPGSEAVYSNKVENIYVNALKKKEELYDNIWNLGLRNALKEEKISLLIEKKSSRMYSIVHKKPWTGLLSFSIFAVLEASGATRRYFTLD